MAVVELARMDGFLVGATGNLLVAIFVETATLPRLDLLERQQRAFVERQRRILALNVIVGQRVLNPPASVKDRAAQLQAAFKDTTMGAATVVAARGLGAVVARSFFAALALVARDTNPTQVFRSVPEACGWLQAHRDASPDLRAAPSLAADIEAFARKV